MSRFEVRDLRIGRSSERDRDQIAGTIVWDGEHGRAEIAFLVEVEPRRDHMHHPVDIRSESVNAIVERVMGVVAKALDPRNVPDIGPLTPPHASKKDGSSGTD